MRAGGEPATAPGNRRCAEIVSSLIDGKDFTVDVLPSSPLKAANTITSKLIYYQESTKLNILIVYYSRSRSHYHEHYDIEKKNYWLCWLCYAVWALGDVPRVYTTLLIKI